MDLTLVAYEDKDLLQKLKDSKHFAGVTYIEYTLAEWNKLDQAAKSDLVGKKVLIMGHKRNGESAFGKLVLLARKYYSQRINVFIVVKDAYGLSGIQLDLEPSN